MHDVLIGRVADWLRWYRAENGLTQAELAEMLGFSVHRVSKIEQGTNLTLKSLERIAENLGVTAVEILSGRP